MPEPLSQVVVHSFIAALVVEALVRSWEVPPSQLLTFRVGALALPLVVLPVFELLAPFRRADWFNEGPALFASRHLVAFPFNPLWPVFGLGVLLLLRDLSPSLRLRGEGRGEGPTYVKTLVATLAQKAGCAPPPIDLIDTRLPLLLCVGVKTPRLLLSTGLLEQLDEGELQAALAHELSHARHHDVRWSWALLALRVLQPFSPAAQVVGRVATRELEWRADADSVRWTRRPLALASALLKVHAGAPQPLGPGELGLSQRARAIEVEARCRRLLNPSPETPVPPALLVGAGLGLTTLLFFVT